MIILAVFVLGIINYNIYEKQKIKDHGEIILLELTPVDPRSLMQGDYMRLRYALEDKAEVNKLQSHQKRGYMVIRPDNKNVAQFVRFHEGEQLIENERLLHFKRNKHWSESLQIMPNSYMFQEGNAEYYENAKYGVFKFNNNGKHLLVGLADTNRKTIIIGDYTK